MDLLRLPLPLRRLSVWLSEWALVVGVDLLRMPRAEKRTDEGIRIEMGVMGVMMIVDDGMTTVRRTERIEAEMRIVIETGSVLLMVSCSDR